MSRYASPIITKPIKYKGKWYAAIIFLPVNIPQDIALDLENPALKENHHLTFEDNVFCSKVADYEKSPMYGRTTNGNAVEAFKKFIEEEIDKTKKIEQRKIVGSFKKIDEFSMEAKSNG